MTSEVSSCARSVKISGTILSSLLFQLQNCDGDSDPGCVPPLVSNCCLSSAALWAFVAEGFLLGGSYSVEFGTISDSQEQGQKEKKQTTCIQSFVNCGKKYSFYDSYGCLTVEDIRKILRSDLQYVIGWFCYRRGNSRHLMSLRERATHRSLLQLFSHIDNEDFLFLLLTDEAIYNTAIPSIDYTFYQLHDVTFQCVHVEVVNLLSTTQSLYHTVPSSLVLPNNTNVFNSVVNDSRDQLISKVDGVPQEAKHMQSLFRAVLNRMQSLEECVTNGNRTVEQLAEEVAVLKQEKRQRELKKLGAEQVDLVTPSSNEEASLLDDTSSTIKQPFMNSEEDTTDDTDVLSQEIA